MSTILKALDRLERDQKRGEIDRPLREEVSMRTEPQPSSRERGRPRALWALLLLPLLAVGVGTWYAGGFASPEDAAFPAVAAPSSPPAPPRFVPPPTTPERVATVAPAASQAQPSGARAVAPQLATVSVEASADPAPAAPIALATAELSAAALESEVALIDPHRSSQREPKRDRVVAVTPPAVEPEPRTAPAPARTKTAMRAEPPAAARIPEVSSPPPAIAKPAPPHILVSRTVWHPLAERRLAFVEVDRVGKPVRVREGDSLGPLLVRKIEPSGVIFVHDGAELRRGLGSR